MKDKFGEYIQRMPILLNELKGEPLLNRNELKDIPKSGIYVFYREGRPVYVGRSNNLKRRIQEHGRLSSRHNSASLAFNIAKEITGRNEQIPKFITRKELEEAPGFDQAFFLARK